VQTEEEIFINSLNLTKRERFLTDNCHKLTLRVKIGKTVTDICFFSVP